MPKISGLPPIANPADDDVLAIVDDDTTTTKKWSLANVKVWLQAQIDLITTSMITDEAVTAAKIEPQEDWHVVGDPGEPAYENSWQAYDSGTTWGGAEFMKDSLGFVHIRGLVKRSTGSNATIFTLPAGYRPNRHVLFAGYGTAGVNRVDVNDTGEVFIQANAGASYNTLNMIIFKAEN